MAEPTLHNLIQPCNRCWKPVPLGFQAVCKTCKRLYHEDCEKGHACNPEPTQEEEKEVWP